MGDLCGFTDPQRSSQKTSPRIGVWDRSVKKTADQFLHHNHVFNPKDGINICCPPFECPAGPASNQSLLGDRSPSAPYNSYPRPSVITLHDRTAASDEPRRKAPFWVLRGALSVSKPQDRFLWAICRSLNFHCLRLFVGTVSNLHLHPASLGSRPQHLNFGNIAPLEPSTRPPENSTACINLENGVVLGGDIREDVRVKNDHT